MLEFYSGQEIKPAMLTLNCCCEVVVVLGVVVVVLGVVDVVVVVVLVCSCWVVCVHHDHLSCNQ